MIHLDHFLPEPTMTPVRSMVSCVLMAAAAACHGDAITDSPVPSLAAIHFVNAVPDTAKMDFRVVDIVSNAGLFGAAFRGANMFYQGLQAGARRVRVFYDTTDVSVAQTVFSDTQYTYAQDQAYTFIEAGFARTGVAPSRAVWILADQAPDPGANNIGLRVVHAGAGMGNVDVYVIRHQADTLTLTGPVATNVAYGALTAYAAMSADTQTQALRVVVTATGATAPILANVALPTGTAGAAGPPATNPIAGARIPGSVLTAVVVPPSVPGSKAASFATAGAVIVVDRRPPDTAP
jgi:Domain of unknown function (DUF4397)